MPLNQLGLKKGQIPESGATGEGIEIHRIENELMAHTSGYTMLDHSHMAFLYDRIPMETPVAIVGARQEQNSIAHTFATHDDRKGESSPP